MIDVVSRVFAATELGFDDADKAKANFKKGRLVVTLPKTPAARKAEKKIAVKAD